MGRKSEQLQIRVTAGQKAMLKRRAQASGLDLSSYVLSRALPAEAERFAAIVRSVQNDARRSYALAELNDFLVAAAPDTFAESMDVVPSPAMSAYVRNYVAAMVEQAAHQKGVDPPGWTHNIEPLAEPHFVTTLTSLRPHLLRAAPVPFKRRNIFVDAAVGARI